MHPSASTDPTVVRISSPADILGVLPHRLGFHPRESLVVVCLEGARRRDRLVMRADLVPSAHDDAVVDDLVARAEHAGATAAVLVCYTEAPAEPGEGLARTGLVEALGDRFEAHGINVVEALLVRDGRWWSYLCDVESCCPLSGSPLPAELSPAAAHYAAEAVAQGRSVLADRDELERGITPSDHAVAVAVREQALAAAGDELMQAVGSGGLEEASRRTVARVRRLVATQAAGGCAVEASDAAFVALGLRDRRTRDEVMTLVLDHEPGVLVGLFSELARRTGDVDAAPVCTVLAWAAYADGGGALAAVAAERALRCEPGYRMAELVLDGLSRMVPPSAIRDMTADVRAELETRAGD